LTLAAKSVRYWHTLRHLKPVQFYGRLWFKLQQPKIDVVALAPSLRIQQGKWQSPVAHKPTMLGPCRFKFLGVEHDLPANEGWNDSALEKLWLYNLHYFEDLNAESAHARTSWHSALMQRWVAENPPPSGNGWEPYPTSLRIMNWVKWALAGNTLPAGCAQSLATQTRWLCKQLEVHLLGNHLFANAKALVFAGLYFEGSEAEQWLVKGLKILARELPEQVLPDGGNFERSPMYHAIFLEDLLDLLNIAGAYTNQVPTTLVVLWRDALFRMLDWLQGMTHPDGQIALFNDAAFGVAATSDELAAYAGRVLGTDAVLSGLPRRCAPGNDRGGLHLSQWADSGYIRLECADAIALLDVAPIGPDYLPGHAHADTLSFELSVFGQRVIVNGGTSRYGLGPERLRERQTESHSTVEVGGQSSSEVWGGFRVARRAYPFDLTVSERSEVLSVACSHNGYKRLPGKPMHRRSWQLSPNYMEVVDSVSGSGWYAVARYILHPDVSVERVAPDSFHLKLVNGKLILVKVSNGSGRLENTGFAPEFGKVLPTQCIAVDLQDGKAQVQLSWS
jgi:uncharacterized heparinase superfamily protein